LVIRLGLTQRATTSGILAPWRDRQGADQRQL